MAPQAYSPSLASLTRQALDALAHAVYSALVPPLVSLLQTRVLLANSCLFSPSLTPLGFYRPLKTSLSASALTNFVSLWRENYSLHHSVQHYFIYIVLSYVMLFHVVNLSPPMMWQHFYNRTHGFYSCCTS